MSSTYSESTNLICKLYNLDKLKKVSSMAEISIPKSVLFNQPRKMQVHRPVSAHMKPSSKEQINIFKRTLNADFELPKIASFKSANLDGSYLMKEKRAKDHIGTSIEKKTIGEKIIINNSIKSNRSSRKFIDCTPKQSPIKNYIRPQSAVIKKTSKREWSSGISKVLVFNKEDLMLNKTIASENLDSCVAFLKPMSMFVKMSKIQESLKWKPICNEYIVCVFGRVEINKVSYFLTQNFNNSSVRNNLEFFGACKEELAKKQLKSLVYGVVHCHSRGIIHNRINIDSVFVGNSGNFVLDFVQNSQKSPTEKEIEKYLYYFAPELISKGEVNEGCDVWAIGCLALEMLQNDIHENSLHPYNHENSITSLIKDKITTPKEIYMKNARRTSKSFNEISKEANKFISDCLIVDSRARIDMSNLLDHDFFKGVKLS